MDTKKKYAAVGVVVALGVGLRLYVSTLGWTQDLNYAQKTVELYRVGNWEAITSGPWVTTGPVPMLCLLLISSLPISIGWGIVLWGTCVDLAIAGMLWGRLDGRVAAIFFLNPISIVVTGYQRVGAEMQLMLGLAAILLYERDRLWSAVLVFPLSLLCKPTLFLLPLWLMLRSGCPWRTRVMWAIPWILWAVGLWLYAPALFAGLRDYHSTNNAPFWLSFDVGHMTKWVGFRELMVVAVCAAGLWYRRERPLELFAVYTICVVIYAAALANHYLTIPLAGLAMAWNRWALAYVVLGGVFELSSPQGLHLSALQPWFPVAGDGLLAMPVYRALIVLLMLHLATRQPVGERCP